MCVGSCGGLEMGVLWPWTPVARPRPSRLLGAWPQSSPRPWGSPRHGFPSAPAATEPSRPRRSPSAITPGSSPLPPQPPPPPETPRPVTLSPAWSGHEDGSGQVCSPRSPGSEQVPCGKMGEMVRVKQSRGQRVWLGRTLMCPLPGGPGYGEASWGSRRAFFPAGGGLRGECRQLAKAAWSLLRCPGSAGLWERP